VPTLISLHSPIALSFPCCHCRTLPELTHRVYFDISIDDKEAGRIVFGLFGQNSPEAVTNFLELATCSQGSKFCYHHSIFHRIIPNFALQGGDIVHGNGQGKTSIYGSQPFDARMLHQEVRFSKPKMLATAASPASSQFIITTVKTQWLTGKLTPFGIVLEGSAVVDAIEATGTYGGRPRANVVISHSGQLPLQPSDKEPLYY
jgi:peptidylprolyl isomerase